MTSRQHQLPRPEPDGQPTESSQLERYPNLRVIFSTAAGVDHITRDPHLPAGVPIVRMGAAEMAQTVGEYVCLATLSILRDAKRLVAAQAAQRWDPFEAPRTALDTRVGIMGLGNIGQVAARMLQGLGFAVAGWARSRGYVAGIETYAGPNELAAFLGRSHILVGLLPETSQTHGLIDRCRIDQLPRGAGIVNAGRGSLIVMPDLIAALDEGQLSAAFLDVFESEPLPAGHAVWHHPRITVTSHVAGFASRRSRARSVVQALVAHESGTPLPNLYRAERGY